MLRSGRAVLASDSMRCTSDAASAFVGSRPNRAASLFHTVLGLLFCQVIVTCIGWLRVTLDGSKINDRCSVSTGVYQKSVKYYFFFHGGCRHAEQEQEASEADGRSGA